MGIPESKRDIRSRSLESENGTLHDLDENIVFVVDDDPQARRSVCALVISMGIESRSYESAEEFLASYRGQPGCLVTDVRMLGMSGVELQRRLKEDGVRLPVVIVSAFAKAKLVVQAIENGVIGFLDKPYADDELWEAIRDALLAGKRWRRDNDRKALICERLAKLTDNEQAVLRYVIDGLPNKKIASILNISLRTVENRRHQIYAKMHADSVAELVRLVFEAKGIEGR